MGKVIDKYKMAKHFELTITEECFYCQRKTRNIDNEAALDGIRTDEPRRTLSTEGTVRFYDLCNMVGELR